MTQTPQTKNQNSWIPQANENGCIICAARDRMEWMGACAATIRTNHPRKPNWQAKTCNLNPTSDYSVGRLRSGLQLLKIHDPVLREILPMTIGDR